MQYIALNLRSIHDTIGGIIIAVGSGLFVSLLQRLAIAQYVGLLCVTLLNAVSELKM